jgi:hypothetical protein
MAKTTAKKEWFLSHKNAQKSIKNGLINEGHLSITA